MPQPDELAKARLIELKDDWSGARPGGREVIVQFNPESLKVTYANQVASPEGNGSQNDPQKLQFVGSGTTKLAAQLWFDVSGQAADAQQPRTDVRDLTAQVTFFMTPKPTPDGKKFTIPAVRFLWGSFMFDGVMESLDETLEYFSPQGIPLRASMSFGLTQQKIVVLRNDLAGGAPGGPALPQPGTAPLTPAREGESVQQMVARGGAAADWKAVAAANGIENPRFVAPGTLVNLNPARVQSPGVRIGRSRI